MHKCCPELYDELKSYYHWVRRSFRDRLGGINHLGKETSLNPPVATFNQVRQIYG